MGSSTRAMDECINVFQGGKKFHLPLSPRHDETEAQKGGHRIHVASRRKGSRPADALDFLYCGTIVAWPNEPTLLSSLSDRSTSDV